MKFKASWTNTYQKRLCQYFCVNPSMQEKKIFKKMDEKKIDFIFLEFCQIIWIKFGQAAAKTKHLRKMLARPLPKNFWCYFVIRIRKCDQLHQKYRFRNKKKIQRILQHFSYAKVVFNKTRTQMDNSSAWWKKNGPRKIRKQNQHSHGQFFSSRHKNWQWKKVV